MRTIKIKLILLLLSALISSCSVIDNGRYHTYRPSASNSFTGLIAGELSDPPVSSMVANCSYFGGLDYSSIQSEETPSWKVTGYVYKSYRCLGPQKSIPQNASNQLSPPEEKSVPVSVKPSLEDAKLKCTELGFSSGTEGFGNCVLKLTK